MKSVAARHSARNKQREGKNFLRSTERGSLEKSEKDSEIKEEKKKMRDEGKAKILTRREVGKFGGMKVEARRSNHRRIRWSPGAERIS